MIRVIFRSPKWFVPIYISLTIIFSLFAFWIPIAFLLSLVFEWKSEPFFVLSALIFLFFWCVAPKLSLRLIKRFSTIATPIECIKPSIISFAVLILSIILTVYFFVDTYYFIQLALYGFFLCFIFAIMTKNSFSEIAGRKNEEGEKKKRKKRLKKILSNGLSLSISAQPLLFHFLFSGL